MLSPSGVVQPPLCTLLCQEIRKSIWNGIFSKKNVIQLNLEELILLIRNSSLY